MTERPTTARVGAAEFKITWEQDDAWSRSANCSAQFDALKQTIRVYVGDGCPAMIASRFMHEVGHALIYMHDLAEKERLTEEQAANAIGYELADFWRSNPEVFRWYAEALGFPLVDLPKG